MAMCSSNRSQVKAGDWIVDKDGKLTALSEGVAYFPSGCAETACAQIYSGSEPVGMDHLVVRFKLETQACYGRMALR